MGNNIKFLRVKHGYTQKELGEKIGMHAHAVGYAENHKCTPKLAKTVAKVLDENIFEVMGSDVLKIMPTTQEEKAILVKIIEKL